MKKTTKADKFNKVKNFDKRIKVTSNHKLQFQNGKKMKVDGLIYKIVNTIFDEKKTYVVYLKFLKPEVRKK